MIDTVFNRVSNILFDTIKIQVLYKLGEKNSQLFPI